VALFLIEKGASLNHQDNVRVACPLISSHLSQKRDTCLHLACLNGHPAVISLLLENGRGVDLEVRNKVCLPSPLLSPSLHLISGQEGKTPEEVLCRGWKADNQKKPECLAVLEAFKTVGSL
jgi:hypothetical protein